MNIPLNGRIAIIDNEEKEAMPLMRVFAKNQIPYVFYKADDIRFLPDEDSRYNDIRLLFLDINLLNNRAATLKDVKSTLYGVLRKVVSSNNFPYSLIYWSKQEAEYSKLVEELFLNELKDRAPINLSSFIKSDFFPSFSDEEVPNQLDLLDEIGKIILSDPAYSYLLNWENQVHKSADATLQEVFRSYHSFPDWTDNANFLINKLGESYSGKGTFKKQTPEEKIKSSFQAFNNVFYDSLEFSTMKTPIQNPQELSEGQSNTDSIQSINAKLLSSIDIEPIEYSGSIIEDLNSENDKPFNDLLNNSIARSKFFEIEKAKQENITKSKKEIGNLIDKICKNKREEIRKEWRKIYCVVTPLCDFVQKKFEYSRVVKGMLIKAEHRNCIDEKSEAIFISPSFSFEKDTYIMVLHFRYFFTHKYSEDDKGLKPIFRIRQQFLAEVQSKLARHISRQGILFLEE